ncbi:histidine kinase [Sinomonas sp. ASV486]|uniref:sensor histidine kinase n=1 Tax=Sinomonas sp. ASV486 TaxID=3051170 RepID=UPI0027DBE2B2|nr:histidine kinase [Sinomonas sp. ASV486]MDQ4489664.1 histidine kinase [Sinomonas sp. ASV486]
MARLVKRILFVLLGSLLSAPYVAVVVWAIALYRFGSVNPLAPLFGTGVAIGLFAVPAALRVTASLERTASDELLGTRLGRDAPPAELGDVLRAALWFGVHLATGFLAAVFLVILLPATAAVAVDALGGGPGLIPGLLEGVGTGTTAVLLSAGTLASAALLTVVVSQLPRWAAFLLGPSAGQRVALAEREARAAAARNHLARELHDSIGHALTVTTLQAAAARAQLGTDPGAAYAALTAVEETGRRAQGELDAALAVLRDPGSPQASGTLAEPPGLAQLDELVATFSAAGLTVHLTADRACRTGALPAGASREAYRMVQEALTNALRHGAEPVAHVWLALDGAWLRIRVTNPSDPGTLVCARPGTPSTGRGLLGLRERVLLRGGSLEAGRSDGTWTVVGALPLGDRGDRMEGGDPW